MKKLLVLAPLLMVGCAGSSATTLDGAEADTTAGGEAPALPELEPMRATVPIAVPLPGRPRSTLTAELQQVWENVELTVAITPPEPPEGTSVEEVEAWAAGSFTDWLRARQTATDLALDAMRAMGSAPLEERAVGAGLLGYLYEDTVSSIRGAPVPEAVATDAELLGIYVESLDRALLPYANLSAQAYYGCLMLFQEVEDPAWGEWPAYCHDRAVDIVETFRLVDEEPPPLPEADAGLTPSRR